MKVEVNSDETIVEVENSSSGLPALLEWQDLKNRSFFEAKLRSVDQKSGKFCIVLMCSHLPEAMWVNGNELRLIKPDNAQVSATVQLTRFIGRVV